MDGNDNGTRYWGSNDNECKEFFKKRTALHWASHRGQEQIVRILLSNGANPAIETHKGQTALDLAAQKYPQVAEMLKEVTPADRTAAAPEPELPIVPKYLKEPDLEKSWLHPDEFSDARPASRPVSTETQNEQQKQEVEQGMSVSAQRKEIDSRF